MRPIVNRSSAALLIEYINKTYITNTDELIFI